MIPLLENPRIVNFEMLRIVCVGLAFLLNACRLEKSHYEMPMIVVSENQLKVERVHPEVAVGLSNIFINSEDQSAQNAVPKALFQTSEGFLLLYQSGRDYYFNRLSSDGPDSFVLDGSPVTSIGSQ